MLHVDPVTEPCSALATHEMHCSYGSIFRFCYGESDLITNVIVQPSHKLETVLIWWHATTAEDLSIDAIPNVAVTFLYQH